MKSVFTTSDRRPRESGGPEPAPGLNRGQPLRPCRPWIPGKAQGCPGKSGVSESELVLNIESGMQGGWGLGEVGDGSVLEQASAHEICKAQCEQVRAAVARGDAQQQISDHRGKDLQANGVFGTTEKGADFEMLLEPAKQQFDLPAFAIERGDRAGRAVEVVAQDGEQTIILTAQYDPAQGDRQPQAPLSGAPQ